MKLKQIREGRSEADVAGEFVYRIKMDGRLKVVLEVRLPSAHHRSKKFRVDALVADLEDNVVCAIEFKKPGKSVGRRTRQSLAYSDLGIPHFYVIGMHGVSKILPLVFAAAGLSDAVGAWDRFGKSAISNSGRVKNSVVLNTLH